MADHFAHIQGVRHTCLIWMQKGGIWKATCTCKEMIEKSGGQVEVLTLWRMHIQDSAVCKDVIPYFTSIK